MLVRQRRRDFWHRRRSCCEEQSLQAVAAMLSWACPRSSERPTSSSWDW